MPLPFVKMHGLGNDFVIVDRRTQPLDLTADQRRALADRRRGVGCDQLILLDGGTNADLTMRIFNPDGEEAEACGNAARCVGQLLGRPATIATAGGRIRTEPVDGGVRVDMGPPRFGWRDIPLAREMDTAALPLAWGSLASPAAISVGNPHVVFFVDNAATIPLEELGPVIEHDQAFPQRINVGVAQVDDTGLTLRVWERGAGLTQACGTAACAAAVAAIRADRASSPVAVRLPGGELTIEWEGASVHMTGPATRVFDGTVELETLA